ncbi:MAG TPA: diacylglycerol kinase family protein [Candidatus Polarisedimenticolaceae bacterium]|nr:diacylglycerol kinase family protein [Candidatus Polarisedimenticolaceae bacterium]
MPAPKRRPRRVLVIANPNAGLLRGGKAAGERAAAAAARAGVAVDLHLTRGPGDARTRAAAAAEEGYDLVLAAGGDGTAHEAAGGLAGSNTALGVAPAGTMNLLARVLGTPLHPAEAAGALAAGFHPWTVHPGDADGRIFVLMAGAGFDAWVLRELLRTVRGKIGFADYARGALAGLRTFPFPELRVAWESRERKAHSVIVGRSPLYGGFLRPTPGARLDEPVLEVCALDGGPARLMAILSRMWSGAHAGAPGALVARTREVRVVSPVDDVPYHLDGELAGVLPVTLRISDRPLVLARTRPV